MGYVTVYDGRVPGAPSRQRYDGMAAVAIEVCNEAPKSPEHILAHGKRNGLAEADDPVMMEKVLTELVDRRILYTERGKYFTLALPANTYH
jgi:hypothetical protein